MKIAVIGAGYVGLPTALLLSQRHSVAAVDIDRQKLETLRALRSPIADRETEAFLAEAREGKRKLDLSLTEDASEGCVGADFILICLPTDLDERTDRVDCGLVESTIGTIVREARGREEHPCVAILSTVPIGFTRQLCERYPDQSILYCPEFIRSGRAMRDNLHPSRIVIGCGEDRAKAQAFAELIRGMAEKKEIETLLLGYEEAEAVKLFANSYLAMRVAFFNEIDSFSECRGLSSGNIIRGVCLDERIGEYYNNPSLGYGGHCLPKDVKQMRECFADVPSRLVGAIVEANETRKAHIAGRILARLEQAAPGENCVGIFRLSAKENTNDMRGAAILDVMRALEREGVRMIVFEPALESASFMGCTVENDLERFKRVCGCIVANRWDERLNDVREKVYTRDLYERD